MKINHMALQKTALDSFGFVGKTVCSFTSKVKTIRIGEGLGKCMANVLNSQ